MVAALPKGVPHRKLGDVVVKGKTVATEVFEALPDHSSDSFLKAMKDYERALEAFAERRFESVRRILAAHSVLMNDPPSRKLLELCNEFETSPPPEEWRGEFVITNK